MELHRLKKSTAWLGKMSAESVFRILISHAGIFEYVQRVLVMDSSNYFEQMHLQITPIVIQKSNLVNHEALLGS